MALLREWVLWRAKNHQLIGNPRFGNNIAVLVIPFGSSPEVELIVGNLLHNLCGIVHMQAHLAARGVAA